MRAGSQPLAFFLEHANRCRSTATDSATEVIYPEVSHFEQTQRREVSYFREWTMDGSHQARPTAFDKITGRTWLIAPGHKAMASPQHHSPATGHRPLNAHTITRVGDQSQPGVERRFPCY